MDGNDCCEQLRAEVETALEALRRAERLMMLLVGFREGDTQVRGAAGWLIGVRQETQLIASRVDAIRADAARP